MSVQTSSPTTVLVVEKKRKRTSVIVSKWIVEIVKYLLLIVLSLSFLLPFYWMISSALKNDVQVYTVPPVWFPVPARWINFWEAWNVDNFNLYVLNTVFRYAIPSTLGTLISCTLVAYGFGRVRWPGRDFLFAICLMTMMVPFQVQMVPLFIIFKKFDWINSYRPLVVPAFFGSAYYIFMLRQFFKTIPEELSDAARIDGANELGILWHIMLPLVKPALTVVGLFQFMGAWNDYLGPLIYVNQSHLYSLAMGLASLSSNITQSGIKHLAYPYLMAVSTVVTVPIVLLFFFAQRTFIEGISLTGIKG
jgi:ABC-type glycerol-3-phosphate transport system permease component